MPRQIVIGLWNYDSTSRDNLRKGIGARFHQLEAVLAKCAGLRGPAVNPPPEVDTIVLAPEYYFTAQSPGGERTPLGEAERRRLEVLLLDLSRRFPRTLLVPGTVFHAKALTRPAGGPANKFGPDGTRSVPKHPDGDRRGRTADKLFAAMAGIGSSGAALWAGKDDTRRRIAWEGRTDGGDRIPSLEEQCDAVQDLTKTPRVVRNAAHLLLNGARVAKYDKQADFFETGGRAGPDDLVFVPGTRDQCPAAGGYRFGAEVCYDHALGMLKRRNPPGLDFHLLVSDYTSNKEEHMAMKKGGYFLHASTRLTETRAFLNRDGAVEEVGLDDLIDIGGGTLCVHRVEATPAS